VAPAPCIILHCSAAAFDTEEEAIGAQLQRLLLTRIKRMVIFMMVSDFNDLIGATTCGLEDLNYSSYDDDDDYHQEIARLIEYSDATKVTHGQRQTNIICGDPQPPDYLGMNSAELAEAKKEYKRKRKRYTYGLRMKHLNNQNKDIEPDSFTRCLFLSLQPMTDVRQFG